MTNNDTAERVARAMHTAQMAKVGRPEEWEAVPFVRQKIYTRLASAAIAAMSEWQPIETAPRDGTKVLIWVPHLKEVFAAAFDKGTWQHGVWTANRKDTEPTFWQPLPTKPAIDETA